MKTVVAAFLLTTMASAFSADYGDRNCQIYVVAAGNVVSSYGNYYVADVLVKQTLINQYFRTSSVVSLHFNDGKGQWQRTAMVPTHREGSAVLYKARLPMGAVVNSDGVVLTASITNGIDSLYDNNSGSDIVLRSSNNWKFTSHCGR